MIARVAFPIPLNKFFDYRIPEKLEPKAGVGSRIRAPFGRRSATGVIVEIMSSSSVPKIKDLDEILDEIPSIPKEIMNLAKFMADHYLCSLGEALGVCGVTGVAPKRNVKTKEIDDETAVYVRHPKLSPDQNKALSMIERQSKLDKPGVVVLEGVTSSGKTEVYLRAAENYLAQGKSVLYLLPEIALTSRAARGIQKRFGTIVAVYHSAIARGERYRTYNRILSGEARLVVGARSAVFAPLKDLGLVIVDEEAESAYKQEETPRYQARDLAVLRAQRAGALAVLGSATPSMETLHNVKRARYAHVRLPERIDSRPLPEIRLLDLRKHIGKNAFLSFPLREAIRERIEKKEQIILLLNRRGFATLIACGDCAEPVRCKRCAVSMVLHQNPRALKCHYCDLTIAVPTVCEACSGKQLTPLGAGTQRIEIEVAEVFPGLRVARVDADVATKKNQVDSTLRAFARGEIDLLTGTQMVAKGLDFPRVTLVGVISADFSLAMPDFRAEERTFQLLTQVAGRAGRGDRPGLVLIQTRNPEHPVLQAVSTGNSMEYMDQQLRARKVLGYPPFLRLARVLFESLSEKAAEDQAKKFAEAASQAGASARVLGPAAAPLSKLRGRYRFHVLIKAAKPSQVRKTIYQGLGVLPKGGKVIIRVDIDPQSML